jgi:hypothetical protein
MKGEISLQRHRGHGAGTPCQGFNPLRDFCISVANWILIRVYSRAFAGDSFICVYLHSSAVEFLSRNFYVVKNRYSD